ncbi:MAG: hypothetical protein ACR2LA_08395 [Acidimicrobiales bacterium]
MNTEPCATTIPSHNRVGRTVAALAVAAALLAGCSGQRDPGSYTADVKRDFVAGCWTTTIFDKYPKIEVAQSDSRADREAKAAEGASATDVRAAKTTCTCAYAQIKQKVKFGTFRSVNENLREDGGKLPPVFTKAFESCVKRG